jgi:serine/threonine protein kinase
MKQGAWTDIYALGATMHFLLLGKPPPPAPGRSIQDTMPPLAQQNLVGCSKEFLELIDWMLTPLPNERPQSVAAVRDALAGKVAPPRKSPTPGLRTHRAAARCRHRRPGRRRRDGGRAARPDRISAVR